MDMQFPVFPEDEFVLYATLLAIPNGGDKLEHHLRRLVRLTLSEPGTLDYVIARDVENTDIFHVYEKYTGREAFEKHITGQEFKDFAAAGLLARPPAPKALKPLQPL
ncbi:hypothetical protein BGW36DRAFT_431123 [Talaromyces proteolyticus]|uniref:ABM domain-containing protein n=1 Tax=Talaromyces proteolyticus TaxID=1131652 RepID=A0AAD4KN70_9EURO|nr:uncharacterized protein BGW36DRAFT_431123 [Talaromyces proteolyticus]KAH8691880.1 hypothetical protein BGW36DRAFT_431123 [Talaromyces proteolyticus]